MFRFFENKLMDWKNPGMKKPLMVVGMRQIGKSYTIENFCKNNFEKHLFFNLEKNIDVRKIFEKTIDDVKIIEEIELYIGEKIDLEKTVFFFDEVQVCEEFIVSLKYFNESNLPYKIICAGSLLGVKINRFTSSFPVGKVRIEYMYPMNFEEFLIATGKELLLNKIKECYKSFESMSEIAHNQAMQLYKQYLCVGGMPESVQNFIDNKCDILLYDKRIIQSIFEMYIADMKKYVTNNLETVKIEKVYKTLPSQLANEKKHFQYNLIEDSARKRKYELPIEWLVSSRNGYKL